MNDEISLLALCLIILRQIRSPALANMLDLAQSIFSAARLSKPAGISHSKNSVPCAI